MAFVDKRKKEKKDRSIESLRNYNKIVLERMPEHYKVSLVPLIYYIKIISLNSLNATANSCNICCVVGCVSRMDRAGGLGWS